MKLNYFSVIFTLIISICVSSVVFAQDKVGTSAAPFLGINIGAGAMAMGGAYVAQATDASALYWNPGAISRVGSSYISFTHTSWFVDTDYNWGGIILNIGNGNALGLNLAILDYGEDVVRTVDQPEGTGQRWNAQDLYASLCYARNLTDRFSIGGSVKYIQQKIYNESASGYALDLGLLYITRFRGMRLGMSISNFGSDMRMDGKDLFHTYDQDPDNLGNNSTISSKLRTDVWPLPLFYRVGVAMDIFTFAQTTLMMTTDAVVPSDNSTIMNVGGELSWNQLFFLRAGYKSLMRPDTEEGFSAGVGFKYFVPGLGKVSLDYAYNDYGLLEEIHTIGMGFSF